METDQFESTHHHFAVGETLDSHELKIVSLVYDYQNRKQEIMALLEALDQLKSAFSVIRDIRVWILSISDSSHYFESNGINHQRLYQDVSHKLGIEDAAEMEQWIEQYCPNFYEAIKSMQPILSDLQHTRDNLHFEMTSLKNTLDHKFIQCSQIQQGIIQLYNAELDINE